jgi:hypothetical protein
MGETEYPGDPPDWRELGVLVLDGSVSMTWDIEELKELGFGGKKAAAVNMAVRDLLTRFKIGRKKNNFTFAVVKFHEYVTEEIPPIPVVISCSPAPGRSCKGRPVWRMPLPAFA